MFQFTGFPPCRYVFAARYTRFARMGFPIQTPADHCPFAAPHSFSQLTASFFGSHCQGIRPALFVNLTKMYPLLLPLRTYQVPHLLLFSMASLPHSVGIYPPFHFVSFISCSFLQYIHFFLYCPRMSISASYGFCHNQLL